MKKILKSLGIYILAPLIVEIMLAITLAVFKEINFASALWLTIKKTGELLYEIVTFKISLWVVILVIFVFVAFKKILNEIIHKTPSKSQCDILMETYNEDIYEGINYRWEWYNSSNGPQISNLTPICKCGCELDYYMFDPYVECPECKKIYSNTINESSAERVFVNRFRKKLKKLDN